MKPLAEYNLFDDATRECPFPYFQAIRREAPVYYMPEIGAWCVSRYEDLKRCPDAMLVPGASWY